MALARARRSESGFNYWPGFVDALSTLVLSIVFLLSVFLVVQFFLSQEVTGKDKALEQLNAKIAQLNELLSLEKLGERGIAACNPLFTFQTLNNFSLCHGAILEGLGGPNGAFFSRGAGTVTALAEAVHSLLEGDCDRAVAGGADTALHPITWAELVRDGFANRGLMPGEGAAVLALCRRSERSLALLRSVAAVPEGGDIASLTLPSHADLVVLAPWGAPAPDPSPGFLRKKDCLSSTRRKPAKTL